MIQTKSCLELKESERNCVGRCTDCPIRGSVYVGFRGGYDAPVVFVGEAPGLDELRTRKPFTGPSGKLFERVCSMVGIDTSDHAAFITNALRCPQPPDQKAVSKEAILACRERLIDEIAAHPRQLIVLMGGTALKAFTGNMSLKITKERGRLFESEHGLAIATLHPAAILRNNRDYRTYVEDFRYIAEIIQHGPSVRRSPGETQYEIATESTYRQLVEKLSQHFMLAMDIETSGFDDYNDDILCLGVAYATNHVVIFPRALLDKPEVQQLCQYKNMRYIWHNGKFDTKFLQRIGINARVDEDVMLMHYVLDERPGTHDLKQLASVYLGADDYESRLIKPHLKKRTGFVSYAEIPQDDLYEYLAYDCDMTYQLWHQFNQQITENPDYVRHYRHLLIRGSAFLQRVENNGMFVDQDYVNQLETQYTKEIEELRAQIADVAQDYWQPEQYITDTGSKTPLAKLQTFNPSSPMQLSWVLYHRNAMGLRLPKGATKNTSAETLSLLPSNDITELILQLRKAEKALKTYVYGIKTRVEKSPDRRIHPTFLLHSVETGRLSSRNPNAQNFTRGSTLRNMIVAPASRILIEADYSQNELRTLAWYSNDENMIDVYRRGLDLHDIVAEQFHPGWSQLQDADLKREQRTDAKSINFGIPYGKNEYTFSKERGMSVEEARVYIEKWFERFPNVKPFLEKCATIALRGGTLKTPLGRYRRFSVVSDSDRVHVANEARNFPIQSLASDLMLLAAMDMEETLCQEFDARIINIVHDSILIELPDNPELVTRARQFIVDTMRETPKRYIGDRVPFDADSKIGYAWGNLK